MKRAEVKEGVAVIDKDFRDLGTGIIKEVKKTIFKVDFGGKLHSYDYPHARFLKKVK